MPLDIVPHSIRATTATQLYHAGVDEQLIQETTGHASLAVRGYKRTAQYQTVGVQSLLIPGDKKKSRSYSHVQAQNTESSMQIENNGSDTRINSLFKGAQFSNCTINVYKE